MISRPLFIRVADSIETFGPIFHFGCCRACFTVILERSFVFRNGPPEQGRMIFLIFLFGNFFRISKIALCSESSGMRWFFASFIIVFPFATSDSLFASRSVFLALRAAIVGEIPAIPESTLIMISARGSCASLIMPFGFLDARIVFFGRILNFLAWE